MWLECLMAWPAAFALLHESAAVPSAARLGLESYIRCEVSVQIVTYNRPKLLLEALQQIEHQDYPGRISVSIIDDSPVSCSKAVEAFARRSRHRIQYRCLPERRSIGAKRNLAVHQETDAEVICTWDDDDIYSCDRVRLQVQALQSCKCATMERRYFYWSSMGALRSCGLF